MAATAHTRTCPACGRPSPTERNFLKHQRLGELVLVIRQVEKRSRLVWEVPAPEQKEQVA